MASAFGTPIAKGFLFSSAEESIMTAPSTLHPIQPPGNDAATD